MQIHELNTFSGTLGSGTYLAVDNGTDTGKISMQFLPDTEKAIADLQTNIDCIRDKKVLLESGTWSESNPISKVVAASRIRSAYAIPVDAINAITADLTVCNTVSKCKIKRGQIVLALRHSCPRLPRI